MIATIPLEMRDHVWYDAKRNILIVDTLIGFGFKVSYKDWLENVHVFLGEL